MIVSCQHPLLSLISPPTVLNIRSALPSNRQSFALFLRLDALTHNKFTSLTYLSTYILPMARSDVQTLPLMAVNHISFAVPSPQDTARFFEKLLGFKRLKRPAAFENSFDGAWVCGMGLEVHFVQPTSSKRTNRSNRLSNVGKNLPIDPRNDHLSFLCTDRGENSPWRRVVDTLKAWDVRYVERNFPEDDLRQVSLKLVLFTFP